MKRPLGFSGRLSFRKAFIPETWEERYMGVPRSSALGIS